MDITTTHTLRFSMRCPNQSINAAAQAILAGGANSMCMHLRVSALPLPDGTDTATIGSNIAVESHDHDKCTQYWDEVQRALAFIGVDVTSP